MGGKVDFAEIFPCMSDRSVATQTGGREYFFQDVWALRRLGENCPAEHHDFGSRIDGFVGQATVLTKVVYWDIRVPTFNLPRLEMRAGDLCKIPVSDQTLHSVSCLHTVEHVGLGRYGDELNPLGTERAISELQRIVAPGGMLLFSMPVGVESTQFNGYRRWPPKRPIGLFNELELLSFSCINADDQFLENVSPDVMNQSKAGCGLYHFRRPSQ